LRAIEAFLHFDVILSTISALQLFLTASSNFWNWNAFSSIELKLHVFANHEALSSCIDPIGFQANFFCHLIQLKDRGELFGFFAEAYPNFF